MEPNQMFNSKTTDKKSKNKVAIHKASVKSNAHKASMDFALPEILYRRCRAQRLPERSADTLCRRAESCGPPTRAEHT